MAVVDQIEFQLFHQRGDGQIQLDGLGCIESNAEILAMQAEPEAKGVAAVQHGGAAMFQGPEPAAPVLRASITCSIGSSSRCPSAIASATAA